MQEATKTRILFTWITALILCLSITVGWYLCNTILLSIIPAVLTATGLEGSGFSIATLVMFVASWWGPLFDIIVVVWAIVSSQMEDATSAIYRR